MAFWGGVRDRPTMSQQIIDLDAAGVVALPKVVRLRGTEYKLPGDVPATLYVRMTAAAIADDADELTTTYLHDELLAAFQAYQPELTSLPIGLTEMVRVVNFVYGGGAEAAAEEAAAEAQADPTPTPSTRKKKQPATSPSST